MNAAARELALIGHAKARERVLARARQLAREANMPHDPRLWPELVLSKGDRL